MGALLGRGVGMKADVLDMRRYFAYGGSTIVAVFPPGVIECVWFFLRLRAND